MRSTQGRDPATETQPQRQVGSGWPDDWRSLGGTISSLEKAHSARTPCRGKGHQEWASEGYGTSCQVSLASPPSPAPPLVPAKMCWSQQASSKDHPGTGRETATRDRLPPAAPGPPRPASDHPPPPPPGNPAGRGLGKPQVVLKCTRDRLVPPPTHNPLARSPQNSDILGWGSRGSPSHSLSAKRA